MHDSIYSDCSCFTFWLISPNIFYHLVAAIMTLTATHLVLSESSNRSYPFTLGSHKEDIVSSGSMETLQEIANYFKLVLLSLIHLTIQTSITLSSIICSKCLSQAVNDCFLPNTSYTTTRYDFGNLLCCLIIICTLIRRKNTAIMTIIANSNPLTKFDKLDIRFDQPSKSNTQGLIYAARYNDV